MSSKTPYTSTKNYINGYKLPISILEKMTSQRLNSYINKKLRPRLSNFYCDCRCGSLNWTIYDSHTDEEQDYIEFVKYLKLVQSYFKEKLKKDPLKETINRNHKTHGCTHKSKSQRKTRKK